MTQHGVEASVMRRREIGRIRQGKKAVTPASSAVALSSTGKLNNSMLTTKSREAKVVNITLTMQRFYAKSAM